ncbi:glycoside hydrolase family 3 N-terminal domain-containing protein [Hyphobacterium marinum]|uniref:beta-N-acetylhexosaminidase n=1 Tax=Hyphobacterium marinum TaxID=3116574 RepID=A0ABU7LWN8_9PROT|nr:glycoside hydrolase family 3 N-terminal domain-containing protein [Hyphobacterium sp. Y6023]MEE2565940.1 glycoside hydrolase family 3 N-terminal domain-containing protein [Hyphobacterium sp. Y6023]
MNRRDLLGGVTASGLLAALPATACGAFQSPPLAERAGRMLLLGFIGDNPDTEGADIVAGHLAAGRIGGVLFLRHNVRSREGVEALAARFRAIRPDAWLALDQEGGAVQRLSGDLGYTPIPRAQNIAQSHSVEEARALYAAAAAEFRAAGFTMNLAPIADVQYDANSVIGRWGRGYGTDGDTIAAYAGAFIDAFENAGVACSIKHFPGHGRSNGDSHEGFVDMTHTWQESELDPFRQLIDNGRAHLIMGGHLIHRGLDPSGDPVTVSRPILHDLLRRDMGYEGALITDDLDMGAIRENFDQREAVIRSVIAGNDMVMMSNSAAPDPELPQKFARWIGEAVDEGRLSEGRIDRSIARLDCLRAVVE